MTEGTELIIHSVDRGQSVYDIESACRRLRPSAVRVDASGRGNVLLHELKAAGLPARALERRRRVLSRDETGMPLIVEGPDDEIGEHFDGTWAGQFYIARDAHGRLTAYELTEPKPVQGIVTLRWVRVTDSELLAKLGVW